MQGWLSWRRQVHPYPCSLRLPTRVWDTLLREPAAGNETSGPGQGQAAFAASASTPPASVVVVLESDFALGSTGAAHYPDGVDVARIDLLRGRNGHEPKREKRVAGLTAGLLVDAQMDVKSLIKGYKRGLIQGYSVITQREAFEQYDATWVSKDMKTKAMECNGV